MACSTWPKRSERFFRINRLLSQIRKRVWTNRRTLNKFVKEKCLPVGTWSTVGLWSTQGCNDYCPCFGHPRFFQTVYNRDGCIWSRAGSCLYVRRPTHCILKQSPLITKSWQIGVRERINGNSFGFPEMTALPSRETLQNLNRPKEPKIPDGAKDHRTWTAKVAGENVRIWFWNPISPWMPEQGCRCLVKKPKVCFKNDSGDGGSNGGSWQLTAWSRRGWKTPRYHSGSVVKS